MNSTTSTNPSTANFPVILKTLPSDPQVVEMPGPIPPITQVFRMPGRIPTIPRVSGMPCSLDFDTPGATPHSWLNHCIINNKTPSCSILLCVFSQKDYNSKKFRLEIKKDSSGSTSSPSNDRELFQAFNKAYNHELRSVWKRYFSLKGLKYITLLEYTETSRPVRVQIDLFSRCDLMYAFNHSDEIVTNTTWVDWVFKLKSDSKRKYALEFVEGWNCERILIIGAVPWVGSCLTAIIWCGMGGDVEVALSVASFILAASGGILALLAILSSLGS